MLACYWSKPDVNHPISGMPVKRTLKKLKSVRWFLSSLLASEMRIILNRLILDNIHICTIHTQTAVEDVVRL